MSCPLLSPPPDGGTPGRRRRPLTTPSEGVKSPPAAHRCIGGKTPYIIARGRKGCSNVAAAIVNALLYQLIRREGF